MLFSAKYFKLCTLSFIPLSPVRLSSLSLQSSPWSQFCHYQPPLVPPPKYHKYTSGTVKWSAKCWISSCSVSRRTQLPGVQARAPAVPAPQLYPSHGELPSGSQVQMGACPPAQALRPLGTGDKRPRDVLRSWWPGCRMQCTRQSHGASHRGKRGSPHCLHTRSARQEHLRLCIAMYAAGNIFLLPPYLNICRYWLFITRVKSFTTCLIQKINANI